MKSKWKLLWIPPAIVLFLTVCGEVVMHLWNWLLPPLFGWHAITFWQALGLLLLCRILFGGLNGHGPGRHRSRLRERWDKMTPEERERLRAGMRWPLRRLWGSRRRNQCSGVSREVSVAGRALEPSRSARSACGAMRCFEPSPVCC